MSLLVLVAHNGKTLQLDVQPHTRVDAVQHALVSFTGIPVADQIVMYQGARLDPAKTLGAYRLPVGHSSLQAAADDQPLFLYCRSYLRPGAALPPPEVLPPLQVHVPPLAEVALSHPLHSAPSPLVRALPDYERHFQHHLATTRAYWDVAQARLHRCRQLLSEQEVQARAADAARANVEAHYHHILTSYHTFLDKYTAQHAAHALLLSTFPHDLAALEAISLHPALQTPTARTLGDLYPLSRLREWHETCGRSHASFGAKVAELGALFQGLRKDVEALFMQAPSVDLDALGRQLAESEALLDEHSSMVQVLSKDLRTVRSLVEDVVRQLGAQGGQGTPGPGGSGAGGGAGGPAGAAGGGLRHGALHDAAAAMEAIHETHRTRVLPRLAQLDGQLSSFASAAEASKVAMTRDVVTQLQRISGQQSRIRDMKNKLAAFHEVLGRQDSAFAELKVVHRLPSAYRALLAEAVRRAAWHELYCGQAARLGEHMVRFRDKEAARRSAFAAQVHRYLPDELLSRAGLASEPPHCQVSVPPPAVPPIPVAVQELQRLSYLDERMAASSSLAASTSRAGSAMRASASPALASAGMGGTSSSSALGGHHGSPPVAHHPHQQQARPHQAHDPGGHGTGAGMHSGTPLLPGTSRQSGTGQGPEGMAAPGSFPGTHAVLDADPPPPTSSTSVEMENARLRAELANHIAAACIRELSETPSPPGTGTAAGTAAAPGSGTAAAGGPQPATAASEQAGVSAGTGKPAQGQGQGQGGKGRDPQELLAAFQRALAMKEDLIHRQQREVVALAARATAYEARIGALEEALAKAAGGGGTASLPTAAAAAVAGAGAGPEGGVAHGGDTDEAAGSGAGDSPAGLQLPEGAEAGGEQRGHAELFLDLTGVEQGAREAGASASPQSPSSPFADPRLQRRGFGVADGTGGTVEQVEGQEGLAGTHGSTARGGGREGRGEEGEGSDSLGSAGPSEAPTLSQGMAGGAEGRQSRSSSGGAASCKVTPAASLEPPGGVEAGEGPGGARGQQRKQKRRQQLQQQGSRSAPSEDVSTSDSVESARALPLPVPVPVPIAAITAVTPWTPGDGRHGGEPTAAGGAGAEEIPLVGSLPFATSLPACSMGASLASGSLSGRLGLGDLPSPPGLAGRGGRAGASMQQQGAQQQRQPRGGAAAPLGGSGAGAAVEEREAGDSDGEEEDGQGETKEDDEPEDQGLRAEGSGSGSEGESGSSGSGSDSGGGSSLSSGSGLQFQPSWTGTPAAGDGGALAGQGQEAGSGDVHRGGPLAGEEERQEEEMEGGEDDGDAGRWTGPAAHPALAERGQQLAAALAAAAGEDGWEEQVKEGEEGGQQGAGSGDDGACDEGSGAGRGSARVDAGAGADRTGGAGDDHCGEEDDDAPDIDEVGEAWAAGAEGGREVVGGEEEGGEVGGLGANVGGGEDEHEDQRGMAAAAVSARTLVVPHGASGAVGGEEGAEEEQEEEQTQAAVEGGSSASLDSLAAAAMAAGEASSGYESVGSG